MIPQRPRVSFPYFFRNKAAPGVDTEEAHPGGPELSSVIRSATYWRSWTSV